MKRTNKPKRNTLQARITSAKTLHEKKLLALHGDVKRTRESEIVRAWMAHWRTQRQIAALRDAAGEDAADTPQIESLVRLCQSYYESAKKPAFDFIREALMNWQPEMLEALAAAMRAGMDGEPTRDLRTFFLTNAAERGPVNFSELAKNISTYEHRNIRDARERKRKTDDAVEAIDKDLRRKAPGLGIKPSGHLMRRRR